MQLFGDKSPNKKKKLPRRKNKKAYKIEINNVSDLTKDGIVNLNDVKYLLKHDKNASLLLHGDDTYAPGDFRSKECVELLKQADIVVTNPPFSLFREYIKQLVNHDKKFLIIGNINATTYKEVFPLLKENKIWLGNNYKVNAGAMFFEIPEDIANLEQVREIKTNESGKKVYVTRVQGVRWFTNLDHGRRHQSLDLMTMKENKRYNKQIQKDKNSYKKYDNYDAIEVPYVKAIPSNYNSVMGVPISFLDKYNLEQFEIIGASDNGAVDEKYKLPHFKKHNEPYINGKKRYKRIFIKHKEK